MKKLSSVWKNINRVSVLITVFSVLMTASFYNPASLAAESSSPFNILIGSTMAWNPSVGDSAFGDRVVFQFPIHDNVADAYLPIIFQPYDSSDFDDDGYERQGRSLRVIG